jgi:hypothetical protein
LKIVYSGSARKKIMPRRICIRKNPRRLAPAGKIYLSKSRNLIGLGPENLPLVSEIIKRWIAISRSELEIGV